MSSNTNKRRIVVTGIGLISPIGNSQETFLESLKTGKSGIGPVDSDVKDVSFRGIGGEVKDFDEKILKKVYFKAKEQKKSIKVMCREIQMGAAAAMAAMEDSGVDLDSIDHAKFGVNFGANLMFYPPPTLAEPCLSCVPEQGGEFDSERWGGDGLKAMEPLWMLKYLPNMPACHVGIFTDARGPNNSVTLDEASTSVSLTEALNVMERSAADLMIVGGAGTKLHSIRTLHSRLWEELGYDETNPSASCKPFDKNRNGQVVSEGTGCLILEEEQHAKARGAKIYATLLGGGSSCVANTDGVANNTQSVINAVSAALKRADLSVSDLGHINAHGLGTVHDDAVEAKAYQSLLEGTDVPVTALKGFFGNAGAGTGFLEIAGSILSLTEGSIPQTISCSNPDESLGLNIVAGEPRATSNKVFANVNFTSMGQASATIFEVA